MNFIDDERLKKVTRVANIVLASFCTNDAVRDMFRLLPHRTFDKFFKGERKPLQMALQTLVTVLDTTLPELKTTSNDLLKAGVNEEMMKELQLSTVVLQIDKQLLPAYREFRLDCTNYEFTGKLANFAQEVFKTLDNSGKLIAGKLALIYENTIDVPDPLASLVVRYKQGIDEPCTNPSKPNEVNPVSTTLSNCCKGINLITSENEMTKLQNSPSVFVVSLQNADKLSPSVSKEAVEKMANALESLIKDTFKGVFEDFLISLQRTYAEPDKIEFKGVTSLNLEKVEQRLQTLGKFYKFEKTVEHTHRVALPTIECILSTTRLTDKKITEADCHRIVIERLDKLTMPIIITIENAVTKHTGKVFSRVQRAGKVIFYVTFDNDDLIEQCMQQISNDAMFTRVSHGFITGSDYRLETLFIMANKIENGEKVHANQLSFEDYHKVCKILTYGLSINVPEFLKLSCESFKSKSGNPLTYDTNVLIIIASYGNFHLKTSDDIEMTTGKDFSNIIGKELGDSLLRVLRSKSTGEKTDLSVKDLLTAYTLCEDIIKIVKG